MLFLMVKNSLNRVHTTRNKLLGALVLSSTFLSLSAFANPISPYHAEYDIFRKGERHGNAKRHFEINEAGKCKLSYRSDIKWMIFTDEREEVAHFECKQTVQPLSYTMAREGTGRDKHYKLEFDAAKSHIISSQSDYPIAMENHEKVYDEISYQYQMRQDLIKGEKTFDYPIVDKKGNKRHYKFEVIGNETITLPFGNVEAVKVKRLYDNDKRQAIVWFAPSMDYLLVRMWKGEKGVEQFDVQLREFKSL